MSALGQKQTLRSEIAMSALPPKADIAARDWDVCFVPKQTYDPRFETAFPSVDPVLSLAGGRRTLARIAWKSSVLPRLSALWPAQSEITLSAEDIAVKACDPLPPA